MDPGAGGLDRCGPYCTILIEQWDTTAVLQIDPKDPTPIYAQLERAIRLAIATGRLRSGDRLPTVRQLAVDLRVNANTVAKVYGELERAGVLETRRGVGTFVASRRDAAESDAERARHLAALGDRFLAEAGALGFTAREAIESLRTAVARRERQTMPAFQTKKADLNLDLPQLRGMNVISFLLLLACVRGRVGVLPPAGCLGDRDRGGRARA